jgi:hypothetical protein
MRRRREMTLRCASIACDMRWPRDAAATTIRRRRRAGTRRRTLLQ